MRSKRLFSVLLCLALSLSLLPATALAVSPIVLSEREKTLYLNDSNPLEMGNAFDFDVTNPREYTINLDWRVSDEDILDVDKYGVVTEKKSAQPPSGAMWKHGLTDRNKPSLCPPRSR